MAFDYSFGGSELEAVPEDDWFCPACREANLWQAAEVRGKRVKRIKNSSVTQYLIHWMGDDTSDDTWEPSSNLSAGAKALTRAFNLTQRSK